jgi:hypothetical protein
MDVRTLLSVVCGMEVLEGEILINMIDPDIELRLLLRANIIELDQNLFPENLPHNSHTILLQTVHDRHGWIIHHIVFDQ